MKSLTTGKTLILSLERPNLETAEMSLFYNILHTLLIIGIRFVFFTFNIFLVTKALSPEYLFYTNVATTGFYIGLIAIS